MKTFALEISVVSGASYWRNVAWSVFTSSSFRCAVNIAIGGSLLRSRACADVVDAGDSDPGRIIWED